MSNVLPGIDWDCGRIPYTYTNPPHDLPTFLLVRIREEINPKFIILKTSFVYRTDHNGPPSIKFWKFKVIDNPFLLIRGGELWYENGTSIGPLPYYIERDATEVRPLGIYSSIIKRTANYMIFPHLNFSDRVYEYTFTHPKNCLPPKYTYVLNEKDVNECFHFLGGVNMCKFRQEYLPPPPTPSLTPSTITIVRIPQFVFRSYVTNAIEKKECCPITLEPLTKENVGCIPCGHLFDKKALEKSLQTSGKCPTCRESAKLNDIQTW
jgi:hypothetical protein